jgi:hypothetical protein
MPALVKWVALNGASIVGMVQAVLKFVKELLTLVINILFPIIPDGKFEQIVLKVRDVVNKVDDFIEKYKGYLLK